MWLHGAISSAKAALGFLILLQHSFGSYSLYEGHMENAVDWLSDGLKDRPVWRNSVQSEQFENLLLTNSWSHVIKVRPLNKRYFNNYITDVDSFPQLLPLPGLTLFSVYVHGVCIYAYMLFDQS